MRNHIGTSLLALSIGLAAGAASAAVTPRSSASGTGTQSFSFTQPIASGTDRLLVVGVAIEAQKEAEALASRVTVGGRQMVELVSARAQAGGKEIIKTQLFYLMSASLPDSGNQEIRVELDGAIKGAVAGATLAMGAKQSAPQSLTATDSSGADLLSRTLALPAGAMLVDVIGSGNCGNFSASSQSIAYQACSGTMSAAGGTQSSGSGFTWKHSNANRLSLSGAILLASDGTLPMPTPVATPAATPVATPVATPKPSATPLPPTTEIPTSGLQGYATVNGTVTGGAGGPTVEVSNLADLKKYLAASGPYIVKISGTIVGSEAIPVSSDKTLLGQGAKLVGLGLKIGSTSKVISNVIVQNIAFEKPIAPIDKIAIANGAHHIWIDHCDFTSDMDHGKDYYDGQIDITHGVDYVTVSWSRFRDHYKNSLVGHSDSNGSEDTGHLTVTYHHNLFENVASRNPSIRFGRAHVYNNYYLNIDNYGIASRMGAEVVVENNYFENVAMPIMADTSLSSTPGKVRGTETNVYKNSGANSISTSPATMTLPYRYQLDDASKVPALVLQGAGSR